MASYIESNLLAGEGVKHTGHTSLWALLPAIILGFILLPVFIGPIFWIWAAIRYYTTEIAITNKRVIAKFGLIQRKTVEMNLNRVESVQVDQGILGRIFNYGSILVSGAGDPKTPVPGISAPLSFRKKVFEVQEESEKATA